MKTIDQLIERQQKGMEILEGIQHFLTLIKSTKQNINGFAGTFPGLKIKYEHNLEIYWMCVRRLEQRYKKVMNTNQVEA